MNKDTQTAARSHMAFIRANALASADGMLHALYFAVATANCPLMQSVNTGKAIREAGADILGWTYAGLTLEQKSAMGCGMTSAKLAAYQYLYVNKDGIYDKFLECYKLENGHLIFWNYILDTLPGMGMVKAAFAVQLLFNKLSCLDVHNCRELGAKMPTGRAVKNRPIYLELQGKKTSLKAWGDWCDAIAARYPAQFESGVYVSYLHVYAIIGGE